ncbi:hypothetical protein ONZ45_g3785 [Pleurotus djamor]|nr:hypothetical protein ONZ45_g3785 [Pleurotus djamor]
MTATTMTMQSLQAFTDSYFSPPTSSKASTSTYYRSSPGLHGFNNARTARTAPNVVAERPAPQQPYQQRQQRHQQQPPLFSTAPTRSPYSHPTRARSRAISLSSSPLQLPNAAVSQAATQQPKQTLPSSSILYTSPYNNNNASQNTWKFTPSEFSFSANSSVSRKNNTHNNSGCRPVTAPRAPLIQVSATVTTTSVSTPTKMSTGSSSPAAKVSSPPPPPPVPSAASYARALSLRASRAKVVAGMMLNRLYSRPTPRRRAPPPSSGSRGEYVRSHLSSVAYSCWDDEEDDDGADSDNESVSSVSSDSSVLTLVADEVFDEKLKYF